jgi:hypothetical protein
MLTVKRVVEIVQMAVTAGIDPHCAREVSTLPTLKPIFKKLTYLV